MQLISPRAFELFLPIHTARIRYVHSISHGIQQESLTLEIPSRFG
jgi:hypothetical protein